jgi:D-sedoheptulose 7-phosphate isomerase
MLLLKNIYKMKLKKNFNLFLENYTQTLAKTVKNISVKELNNATDLIEKTIKRKKTIYVCGNGGSAAIAEHYVCDFVKQLSKYTNLYANIRSLNSDTYLISAIANDISFDEIFRFQASRYINKDDILILISSSGNSKNIKNVLNFCKKKKVKTIGFSNFSGGYLKKNCTISIHSKIDNYGIGEDINHILMHSIMQYIAIKNLIKKKRKIIL